LQRPVIPSSTGDTNNNVSPGRIVCDDVDVMTDRWQSVLMSVGRGKGEKDTEVSKYFLHSNHELCLKISKRPYVVIPDGMPFGMLFGMPFSIKKVLCKSQNVHTSSFLMVAHEKCNMTL
jgi:hypothetical protein